MLNNQTMIEKNTEKDRRSIDIKTVKSEPKSLVDARIEINREGGFVAVKNPTESELSDLSGYVDSSGSVRGYQIREEEKLIVEPCSGGGDYV